MVRRKRQNYWYVDGNDKMYESIKQCIDENGLTVTEKSERVFNVTDPRLKSVFAVSEHDARKLREKRDAKNV